MHVLDCWDRLSWIRSMEYSALLDVVGGYGNCKCSKAYLDARALAEQKLVICALMSLL